MLKECVDRAGMYTSPVTRDRNEFERREVEEKVEYFRTRFSCSSVTLFVINVTYVLSGNHPLENFLENF